MFNAEEKQVLKNQLKERDEKIAQLEQQISWLTKQFFGTGKSEKLDPNQLELFKKKDVESESEKAAEKISVSYDRSKNAKPQSKEEKFSHLPVKETISILPEEVQLNPLDYVEISSRETFEVEMTAPEFYKIVYRYPKFKAKTNKLLPPVVAPAKYQFMQGSFASVNLVTQIIINKFVDHLPLYRQEKMFSRYGYHFDLSRKTMCEWLARASWLFEGLYNNIKAEILSRGYIQIDETPIRYIEGIEKKFKSQKGYFWLINDPYGHVAYVWSCDRSTQTLKNILGEHHKGIVQCDDYSAYNSYAKGKEGFDLVACMAHIRRKFFESHSENPSLCEWVLSIIRQLYKNEKEWKDLTSGQRLILRNNEDVMLFDKLKRACLHVVETRRPSLGLCKAAKYALKNLGKFAVFLDNGQVQLDNNLIENAVRPTKLGAKNWLFIGHKDAGKHAGILYTIVENCRRYNIDPASYVSDALNSLLLEQTPSKKLLNDLMPINYAAKNLKSVV